jgi:uncharacterized protein YkwD
MSQHKFLRRILPLFAAALLIAGCGGGSEGVEGLDPTLGQGNAEQIRKDYAALQPKDAAPLGDAARSAGAGTGPNASALASESESASASASASAEVAPQALPLLDRFAQDALDAVNLARSQARTCGDKSFPAVEALRWNPRAAYAALLESEWMLNSNSFGHAWPGGELVWDRLNLSGYRWSKADENIAAGYRSLADAMQAWIDSPPHCVALMRGDVSDVAIALVPGREGGAFVSYWTMVLASPL